MESKYIIQASYEEKIRELIVKGEVEFPIADCDLQFFLEDSLKILNLKYKKLISLKNRKASVKNLIIKIVS